jgi:metal-dependent hydrolase (beta-lactamase superfamily II)
LFTRGLLIVCKIIDNLNLFLCIFHSPRLKDITLTQEYYRQIIRGFNYTSAADTLAMANMHVFMNNTEAAHWLLKDAMDRGNYDKEILKLYLVLSYFHYDHPLGINYLYAFYNLLMKHKPELTAEEWCGLFRGNTRISFQALDHENLRKVFCETCGDIQLTEPENHFADVEPAKL